MDESVSQAKQPIIVSLTSGRLSGVDVFAADLVRGLIARGYPARLLLTESDLPSLDQMNPPGDLPVDSLTFDPRGGFRTRLHTLKTYLESHSPCIYLPNYDFRHSSICGILTDRIPVIGIVHSDDPLHYRHVRRLGKYWNGIVAVSRFIESNVRQMIPEIQDRLAYIPYGIPPVPIAGDQQSDGDGRLRILYAGRIVQNQKRFGDVIIIAKQLLRREIPFHLTICGGADDGGHLLAPLQGMMESGVAEYRGIVPHDRLQQEYGRHDVYLLPSSFEGLPLGVMEAMAAGCIPVTTNIRSGIPELITDGSNGFLLEIGDTDGFVSRLADLQISAGRRRVMREKVRSSFLESQFTLDRMVSAYIELFDTVWTDSAAGTFKRPPGRLPWTIWKEYLPHSIRRMARRILRRK